MRPQGKANMGVVFDHFMASRHCLQPDGLFIHFWHWLSVALAGEQGQVDCPEAL